VRETFSGFLTGPRLSVAPLESRLASLARDEARTANCPFLLITTVKLSRRTGGGLLGRMAGAAAQQTASSVTSGLGSTTGRIVASAAAGAANAANSYANAVRTHDELALTSRLERMDGTVVFEKTDRRKAQSDGEDLLTPIAEKHAEQIAAAVTRAP
jgi:hypothetical protein